MYDQYYGLSGRPFQLTPDPRFYFESLTHRKALSYLGYGLAQGEGFIVITGEVGAGKSTLVAHLMATIDSARLTAATIVTTQLDRDALVEMVAEEFGIETTGRDKAAVLKAIENFLHAEARAGRRCLLIVDEAQNLPVESLEELRMLSNFQLGATPLLQIFLLGQPEFRAMLQSEPSLEQVRQRVIANHHLDAMGREEIAPYIAHRLQKVGWDGQRPHFSPDAIHMLFDQSGGIPRKLNTLANRALLMGAVEATDTIDGALVEAVVADLHGDRFDYDAPLSSRMNEEAAVPAAQAPGLAEDERAELAKPAVGHVETACKAPDISIAPEMIAPVPQRAAEEALADTDEESGWQAGARPGQSVSAPISIEDFQLAVERICGLELRVSEQQATIRRMLDMLVDWVEHDTRSAQGAVHGLSRGRAA